MIVGRIFEHTAPPLPWDRTPVRAELFGAERLEQHAKSLAAAQAVTASPSRDSRLADRLTDNAAFLLHANRALAKSGDDGHHATPAAEPQARVYDPERTQEAPLQMPMMGYSDLSRRVVWREPANQSEAQRFLSAFGKASPVVSLSVAEAQ